MLVEGGVYVYSCCVQGVVYLNTLVHVVVLKKILESNCKQFELLSHLFMVSASEVASSEPDFCRFHCKSGSCHFGPIEACCVVT